jgi:beta-carotene 3-hydroxylase
MEILIFIAVTIGTFLLMECITWLTHKYVMHGFLWYLHADHHKPKYENVFEKNDAFFIIFAIPSILLFYFGIEPQLNYLFFIGLGILLYGLAYFIVHDIIIHQRIKIFTRTNIAYLKGLRKAHKIHHKNMGKEKSECFGMLNVPKKYFST